MGKSKLQEMEKDRLGRMEWSNGSAGYYYYYDPKNPLRTPVCAIKEGFGLSSVVYGVFWNGWGVSACSDLDVLKKDVEQKHRVDTMKIFTHKGDK